MPEAILSQIQGEKGSQKNQIPVSELQIVLMELSLGQIRDFLKKILGNEFDTEVPPGKSIFDRTFLKKFWPDRENNKDRKPEFAIDENLFVKPISEEVITEIEKTLAQIVDEKIAHFTAHTAQKIWDALDWTTEKKREILEHLASIQGDYILSPDNKLLLKPQTQDDTGEKIGLSASSISRLTKALLIRFPDDSTREARQLIPAAQIERIKGEYALNQLKNDSDFFDPEKGWKKSSEKIAKEIERRFGLVYAGRTIRKYMDDMGDKSCDHHYETEKQKKIEEIDRLIAEYTKRPELFDQRKKEWKLRPTEIRRIIRKETGFIIPKQWIAALKYDNCRESPENLYKRVVKTR